MFLHTKVIGEGEPVIFLRIGLQTGETAKRVLILFLNNVKVRVSNDY